MNKEVEEASKLLVESIQEYGMKMYKVGHENGTKLSESKSDPMIKRAYNKGLNDAWEAVRKIMNMPQKDFYELFNSERPYYVITLKSASEVIEKLKQYDEQHGTVSVEVGDEVLDGVASLVVTSINEDGTVNGFDECGCTYSSVKVRGVTGRHFDIVSETLKQMK